MFLFSLSIDPETATTFPLSLTTSLFWYLNSYHHLELVVVHLMLEDPPFDWISSECDFQLLFLMVLETPSKYHCWALALFLHLFNQTLFAPWHSAILLNGSSDTM
jgi:hypothetical protein